MNARQALSIVKSRGEKIMQPIFKKIMAAAKSGEYQLHIYEVLPEDQTKKLEDLGYQVTSTGLRNELTTTISWKNITPP